MIERAVIEWYGPYSLDEVKEFREWELGIYMITGKLKNKRIPNICYCGITEGSFYQRISNHKKAPKVERDCNFWLGVIEPLKPIPSLGRLERETLEVIENAIIYSLKPELNEMKKNKKPPKITLFNNWFTKNGDRMGSKPQSCKSLDNIIIF